MNTAPGRRLLLVLLLLAGCAAPAPPPAAPPLSAHPAVGFAIEAAKLRTAAEVADLGERVLALQDESRSISRRDFCRAAPARNAAARAAAFRRQAEDLATDPLGVPGRVDLALIGLALDEIEHRSATVLEEEAGAARACPALPDLDALDPAKRWLTGADIEAGLAALARIGAAPDVADPASVPEKAARIARRRLGIAVARVAGWYDLAIESGLPRDSRTDVRDRAIGRLGELRAALGPEPPPDPDAWPEPVGRAEFVRLLRERHMEESAPEEIAAEGRRLLAETRAEMEALVREIAPGRTVEEELESMRELAPTAEELPGLAFRAMTAAREFVIERGLVTVPEDLREGIVRPIGERLARTYPFGAYGGTTWVAGRRVGVYLVSPGVDSMTAEERRERLRGNHPFKTRVVAAHEMWPGHHLQKGIQARLANPLRRRAAANTYVEGWGLYCEELLYRHGFYRDPRTRLAQLDMRRWRACRVVLDPSLHCGGMSPDEAAAFLVANARLLRSNAEAEVRRYLGNPTRPYAYIYGWREIERMREEALARGMEEREFHDRFLAAGALPLPLVRRLVLGD